VVKSKEKPVGVCVMIATAQHSASDDITSGQFTITDLHIQQINLFCYVILADQLHWTMHPTHLPVFEFMLTYGRAHPAEPTVLGCTVSDTLHVSSCTPSGTDCTGLYSIWHATRVIMHTQRNWRYWVVQYLIRYTCHHAHPAELTVLGCTVSDTLRVSLFTPSGTDCTGLYSIWNATRVIMHTQWNWLYWTVQYVTRYMCQHAHTAWIPVLTLVYSTAWSWRSRIENMDTFTHCESTFTPMKRTWSFMLLQNAFACWPPCTVTDKRKY
jgi:hypothetical protein